MLETIILPILIGFVLFLVFYLNVSPKKKPDDKCGEKIFCGDGTYKVGNSCVATGPVDIIEGPDECIVGRVCQYLYINTNLPGIFNGVYEFVSPMSGSPEGKLINVLDNTTNTLKYEDNGLKLLYGDDEIILNLNRNILQGEIEDDNIYLNIFPYKCNCDLKELMTTFMLFQIV